jgi:hypothetical protein
MLNKPGKLFFWGQQLMHLKGIYAQKKRRFEALSWFNSGNAPVCRVRLFEGSDTPPVYP